MGIIGVVAALTLPNLNSSTGEKEKVAKVKKIYSNLNDAMGRVEAVYGPYSDWFVVNAEPSVNSERIGERLTEFLKISKNCGVGYDAPSCFSTSIARAQDYKVILADGTSLNFTDDGEIWVDIDGTNSGKNEKGKDIFGFTIDSQTGEIVPFGQAGLASGDDRTYFEQTVGFNKAGYTAWVIQNENMDYLKCPDKISLSKTTCK